MHNFFIILILLASGVSQARSLKTIQKSKVINILTRNAPTTYYLDKDGKRMPALPKGFYSSSFFVDKTIEFLQSTRADRIVLPARFGTLQGNL